MSYDGHKTNQQSLLPCTYIYCVKCYLFARRRQHWKSRFHSRRPGDQLEGNLVAVLQILKLTQNLGKILLSKK